MDMRVRCTNKDNKQNTRSEGVRASPDYPESSSLPIKEDDISDAKHYIAIKHGDGYVSALSKDIDKLLSLSRKRCHNDIDQILENWKNGTDSPKKELAQAIENSANASARMANHPSRWQ